MKDKDLINLELGKLSLVSSIMCDMGPQSTFLDVREGVARAVGHALDTPLIDLMIIDPFTGQVDCGGSSNVTEQMRQAFMVLGEGILTDLTGFNTLLMEFKLETVNGNRPERALYRAGVRSVLAHPIRSGVGTCGALVAYYTTHEGAGDNRHLVETITAQAAAVLSCARSIEQYSSMLDDLAGEYQELSVQAAVDALTGLMNRHTFQQKLVELCKHGSTRGRPAFCLVMADVDHFKVYNDTHGHPMGDVVLRNIARVLSTGLRQTDLAARYGGEEFTIILKGVDKAQALCAADRIRRAVAEECQSLGHITVSMGVAEFPADADSPGELIEKADNALYSAKSSGRNRVALWDNPDAEEDDEAGGPADGQRSILVVDDPKESRSRLANAVRECGTYLVEQAADMKGAAEALRGRSFDAVMISSEALPGDDVKMIGEIARPQPHMPVILVTLDCDLARSKEAMRNGACDILVWPFTSAELPLLIERNLERRRQERRRLVIRGTNVLMQAMEALVAAVDSRDPFIAGHSEQVAELALGIADQLKLANDERAALEWAAKLHDIGRLGLPDSVFNKESALTQEEWAAMREHPVLGSRILGTIDELAYVSTIVRHHHERLDGSGYPDGMRGAAIPDLSKVIAVADTYAAMTSSRSFRGQMTPEQAMIELRNCAGKQYAANVVEALYAHLVGSGVFDAQAEDQAA